MKFADFVSCAAIRPNLASSSKDEVIREMTTALVEAKEIAQDELESIIKAISI